MHFWVQPGRSDVVVGQPVAVVGEGQRGEARCGTGVVGNPRPIRCRGGGEVRRAVGLGHPQIAEGVLDCAVDVHPAESFRQQRRRVVDPDLNSRHLDANGQRRRVGVRQSIDVVEGDIRPVSDDAVLNRRAVAEVDGIRRAVDLSGHTPDHRVHGANQGVPVRHHQRFRRRNRGGRQHQHSKTGDESRCPTPGGSKQGSHHNRPFRRSVTPCRTAQHPCHSRNSTPKHTHSSRRSRLWLSKRQTRAEFAHMCVYPEQAWSRRP